MAWLIVKTNKWKAREEPVTRDRRLAPMGLRKMTFNIQERDRNRNYRLSISLPLRSALTGS